MENILKQIRSFVEPFYNEKDIMHDISHIERIRFALNDLTIDVDLKFNRFITEAALYFHGIIYSHELEVHEFLKKIGVDENDIKKIAKVAWESQKEHRPTTNEGLILHDAHMLEGGRNFEIIKSLITGSVRGQSLEKTMIYIENNLLKKGQCYTHEGKKRYEKMRNRTFELYEELNQGLGRTNKFGK